MEAKGEESPRKSRQWWQMLQTGPHKDLAIWVQESERSPCQEINIYGTNGKHLGGETLNTISKGRSLSHGFTPSSF